MDQLRAICSRIKGNDLVTVECQRLTGGIPDVEGVAVCERLEDIPRSAYIRLGLRWIAEGKTLPELVEQIQFLRLCCNDFRIEFLRLSGQLTVSKHEAILKIANSISGYPDLTFPTTRFLIVVQRDGLWLGEIMTESGNTFRKHDTKPHHATISLPARLSRALVNLAAPQARTILDPFCGTGSILLEASALGLTAYGSDNNPHMVSITRQNLKFFGYPAHVEYLDILSCRQTANAVITDLPYGRVLQGMDDSQILAILRHCAGLAPQGIFLAGQDISDQMASAGYSGVKVYCVRKRRGMERFVHIGTSRGL